MDISTLAAVIAKDEEGAVIPIFQKNGDPYLAADGSQCTLTVVGTESKRYRDARSVIQRRAMKQQSTQMEPEDLTKNRVDLAVAASIDWHGWEHGSEAIPCSVENLKALFAAEHILEQVEKGISKHAVFLARNSNS